MLKLINVKKTYGDFRLDCSMEVKRGYITGLIGKNGAGKSTVFKTILDLIHMDSGTIMLQPTGSESIETVQIGKRSVQDAVADRDADLEEIKQHIGASFADSGFSSYFTIRQIVPIMEAMYRNFDRNMFLQQCRAAGLPEKKKLKEFSTGMRAKLKVLLAMSYGAKLLILDEPTAGLDVLAREELIDMLRNYMEPGDRSILISSHIAGDLEGLCDDIYMIEEGKIVIHEDTDVLLDQYGVLKVTEDQYEALDKRAVRCVMKDTFGYLCLTEQKAFYLENYPGIIVEKGSIDAVLTLMIRGKRLPIPKGQTENGVQAGDCNRGGCLQGNWKGVES